MINEIVQLYGSSCESISKAIVKAMALIETDLTGYEELISSMCAAVLSLAQIVTGFYLALQLP